MNKFSTVMTSPGPGLNVSTTPLQQWGFRQCLPFSWTTLRGKHCRHPIAIMGVVDMFKPAFQDCTASCHENVPALKAVSSDLRSTDLKLYRTQLGTVIFMVE